MEETAKAYPKDRWGGGPPTARYYDKHGRQHILPADPYSIEHYTDRGFRLHPPESPVPVSEPATVLRTRQAPPKEATGLLDMLGQMDRKQLLGLLAIALETEAAPTEKGNELTVPKAAPRKRAKKGK